MKPPVFLRQEANGEEPNYEAEGLMARLDTFLESGAAREQPPEEPKEVNLNLGEQPPEAPKEEKPTEGAPEAPTLEEEDDLPSIGERNDDSDFEKQTEKEVAGLDPKQAAAWRKIKAREKEARKRALELEEQVKQTRVPQEIESELTRLKAVEREAEALRQRNEELLRANDQVAVRESPEYKSQVEAPLDEMKGIVAKMAEVGQIDPRLLAQVIEEPDIATQDKMFDALSEKLSPRMISRLERLSDDYKAIISREKDLLSKPTKTLEEARVARDREEKEARQRHTEAFRSAVKESFAKYATRIPGFTDSAGALNDMAEAAIAKTEVIDPHSLSSDDLGYMAFATNVLPDLRRAYVAVVQELAALKAGKRSTGGPASGSAPASGGQQHEEEAPDGEPEGLLDRFRKARFDAAV